MKVLVTGATGYVGSHTVMALVQAGHEVRLLVRRPEQVAVTFQPLGISTAVSDVVTGDVLDEEAVKAALDGCDAVVHAAAVYSFDPRSASDMFGTNAEATRVVLHSAVDQSLDPVIHVSSTVALTRHGSNPDLDIGDIDLPYTRSKIASERIARALQERGAPVTIVYPGSVYGPHDPYLGEQAERLRWIVRGRFPIWPKGGLHMVDVRDVAATITALMQSGRGPRRYVVPGHHVEGGRLYAAVEAAIGRRRPHVEMPAAAVSALTRVLDGTQRLLPQRLRHPATREGAELSARDTRLDDSPARQDLGVEPKPFEESIRDTVRWLVDAGHLPQRYAPAGS